MTGYRIEPEPSLDAQWWHRGSCWPDYSLYDSHDDDDIAEAKRICNEVCPVKAECLDDALRHESEPGAARHGVRGGLTEDERAALSPRVGGRKSPSRVGGRRGAPKPPPPCGTYKKYRWHLRHNQNPCDDCTAANRQNSADNRAKDAAKKAREKASA